MNCLVNFINILFLFSIQIKELKEPNSLDSMIKKSEISNLFTFPIQNDEFDKCFAIIAFGTEIEDKKESNFLNTKLNFNNLMKYFRPKQINIHKKSKILCIKNDLNCVEILLLVIVKSNFEFRKLSVNLKEQIFSIESMPNFKTDKTDLKYIEVEEFNDIVYNFMISKSKRNILKENYMITVEKDFIMSTFNNKNNNLFDRHKFSNHNLPTVLISFWTDFLDEETEAIKDIEFLEGTVLNIILKEEFELFNLIYKNTKISILNEILKRCKLIKKKVNKSTNKYYKKFKDFDNFENLLIKVSELDLSNEYKRIFSKQLFLIYESFKDLDFEIEYNPINYVSNINLKNWNILDKDILDVCDKFIKIANNHKKELQKLSFKSKILLCIIFFVGVIVFSTLVVTIYFKNSKIQ